MYGIKSFAKDLLPVADQLQLALENVPVSELGENKALADLKEGIEMTQQQIGKAFEKNQIFLGNIFYQIKKKRSSSLIKMPFHHEISTVPQMLMNLIDILL